MGCGAVVAILSGGAVVNQRRVRNCGVVKNAEKV